jgi:prolyl-tRNA editing enzyme YbaK/EbsC (Cys-tRNA(Pro) deacylase)
MTLKAAAARVQAALEDKGVDLKVRQFPESTRTAAEAAAAIGCDVAQIAKSIVFRAEDSGGPVLVVASGVNRIDEAKVAALIGQAIGRADAAFVREATGYAIGGVPPIGHAVQPITVLDRDLLALTEVWAAAGTPNAVFALAPDTLVALTGGTVGDVKRG